MTKIIKSPSPFAQSEQTSGSISQVRFQATLIFPLLIMLENGNAGDKSSGGNTASGTNSSPFTETAIKMWKYFLGIIGRGWSYCEKEFELTKPLGPKESWKTFLLWVFLIVIDPLICYVPVINDEKKLLEFDKTFSVVLLVLYGVIYVGKLSFYVYKFRKELAKNAGSYSKLWWAFVLVAPLVPVFTNGLLLLILIVKPTTFIRASIFSIGTAVFLILYLGRVLGIYKLFVAAANPSDKPMKTAVLRIGINLILYLYGGHLFGGLWYFFAVWKKMECWNKACINHEGCRYADHRFVVNSGDNSILNDICFNKAEDAKTYELGIFKDALESRIVETKKISKKLLYCFRWGTQNLSGFGQNLEVSTHAWENIFVILLAIYGMGTFTFFIGNMQNLIRSSTGKSEKKSTKQDLENWSPFGKLSKSLQDRIIKEYQQSDWPQAEGVDVKNLLSILPKDIENDIKRGLCLELLKRDEKFQGWSDASLEKLCECVKPVVHIEGSRIIHEGDLVDEMGFVVRGEVWTYSSGVISDTSTNNLEFWGEQLFDWAQKNETSTCNIPKSNKTIQALTKVEAFILTAHDFKKLCNSRRNIAPSQLPSVNNR